MKLMRCFPIPQSASAMLVAALCLLAPGLSLAEQQGSVAPPGRTYTRQQNDLVAALDRQLADYDFESFRATLATMTQDGELISAGLDWGKARTLEGGGIIAPVTYASLLWHAADLNPDYEYLRQTSGLMALYAFLLAMSDGPRCADKTAPEHHSMTIMQQYAKQWQYIAKLPPDKRTVIVDTALAMERKLAPKRTEDRYLCRFGMQEHIDISRKYGDAAYEHVPTRPGEVGKQMALRFDPDYRPKFTPKEQWEPRRQELRGQFPELISKLLESAAGM